MKFILVIAVTVFIEKSCSQILTYSECPTTGKNLNLNCETADLTQSITFSLNGVDQGGCIPLLGCATDITQSGTTTTMAIASFNSASHSGSWACTFGTATSPAVTIAEASCIILCVGITMARGILYGCSICPSVVEIIVLIIIYCCCPRPPRPSNQKVTISLQTKEELKSAEYTIGKTNTKRMDRSGDGHGGFIYSCVVLGQQTVECRFILNENEVKFDFMISDDLLYVNPLCGNDALLLPSIFEPRLTLVGKSEWDFNNAPLKIPSVTCRRDGNVFVSIFEVTCQILGIYNCKISIAEFGGCMLTISNMHVEASDGIYWIPMIGCALFNVLVTVIGGVITASQRLKDGFCIEKLEIGLGCVLPAILLTMVVAAIFYKVFIKRTENEQNSGTFEQMNPTPSQPAAAMIEIEPKLVRNNLLPSLKL